MGQREEKIEELQREAASVTLLYNALKNKIDKINNEIVKIKRSIEPGDQVEWRETCSRGCCIEDQGSGIVESVSDKFYASIRMTDGSIVKKNKHILNRT